jgi:hypothetical protein
MRVLLAYISVSGVLFRRRKRLVANRLIVQCSRAIFIRHSHRGRRHFH